MAEPMLLLGPPDDRGSERNTRLIEQPQLADVLFDQLDYLISHGGQVCRPGCPDCARLEQIKKLLLVPFDSPAISARTAA